jgi:hypothetical protein
MAAKQTAAFAMGYRSSQALLCRSLRVCDDEDVALACVPRPAAHRVHIHLDETPDRSAAALHLRIFSCTATSGCYEVELRAVLLAAER